jgi:predicted nuclease of predicted toxin-antitoxin system
VRFLIDTNLPKSLCAWLAARGHDCEHVLALGLAQADDLDIWRHAAAIGQTVVSKDEDFADLALTTDAGPSVIWVRTGNGTNRQLLSYLDALWPAIQARIEAGDRLVEVR